MADGEGIVLINKETKDLEQTARVKKIGFFDIWLEFENGKVKKIPLEVFFRESRFFVIQEADEGGDKSLSKA